MILFKELFVEILYIGDIMFNYIMANKEEIIFNNETLMFLKSLMDYFFNQDL
jgi:hypothetical protein